MNKVEKIISKFRENEENSVLTTTFMNEFCYDFACILKRNVPEGTICYIEDINHYVFRYERNYYDITGKLRLAEDNIVIEDDGIEELKY